MIALYHTIGSRVVIHATFRQLIIALFQEDCMTATQSYDPLSFNVTSKG